MLHDSYPPEVLVVVVVVVYGANNKPIMPIHQDNKVMMNNST